MEETLNLHLAKNSTCTVKKQIERLFIENVMFKEIATFLVFSIISSARRILVHCLINDAIMN
jgi:hypothetical protein